MKRVAGLVVVLAGLGAVSWSLIGRQRDAAPDYRFVRVERGDVEAVVSATGKLEAITTVEVGTQVSGQIAEILADFNSRVRKGDLVARIDPTLLQQEVRSAEASLSRREAAGDQAVWAFERAKRLNAEGVLNDSDYETARFNQAAAQADLVSARVALERARRNLAYSEIRAPIDGVVVERNVDVGQTVAASLSAPVLFRMAEDLARMRILVAVDESDIGRIAEGQPARFSVQAYPERTFGGAVRQVRLQSTTLENVVNYTVVVEVDNPEGRLLPGMTATVDFLVASARGVLVVPNAALRFLPSEAMLAELRARRGADRADDNSATGGGVRAAERAPGAAAGERGRDDDHRGAPRPRDAAAARPSVLWFVDAQGKLDAVRVRTGITDGRTTEVEAPGIEEGLQVIAGVSQTAAPVAASPFQQGRPDMRSGPPVR